MNTRLPTLLALTILIAVPVAAHDFWLAASRWHVAPGATITVTANVGDDIYP